MLFVLSGYLHALLILCNEPTSETPGRQFQDCLQCFRPLLQSGDQPLDADGCKKSYPNEVPCDRGEGPEEVLPQVGFLQGEVLVGLQAGCHLCQWVGMALMEGLLPKVFILQQMTVCWIILDYFGCGDSTETLKRPRCALSGH